MLRLFPYLLLAGVSAYASPTAHAVLLPAGTQLHVRIDRPLDTKRDPAGTPFAATLLTPITHDGQVVVPQGAVCSGRVVESKPSGKLKGRAVMALALDSVQFRGRTYPIAAASPVFSSSSHKKRNLKWIGGGSAGGAIIGAIAGGGVGTAIGLGAGAAAGTVGAAVKGEKQIQVAAETPIVFTLQHPVEVRGGALRARR